MARLINLTQHSLTQDQISDFHGGIVHLSQEESRRIKELLTFEEIPSSIDIAVQAKQLANVASIAGATHALIGGAPYLMAHLEKRLRQMKIQPLYSFSKRLSIETANDDGTTTKINVFKHVGWVGDAPQPVTFQQVQQDYCCTCQHEVLAIDGKLECGHN